MVRTVPRERGTKVHWTRRRKGRMWWMEGSATCAFRSPLTSVRMTRHACLNTSSCSCQPPSVPSINTSNRPLSNVDNSSLSHLGKVQVDLHLDPIGSTDSRAVQVTMYVVPNLSVACLLGSDFTEKYTKSIDFKGRTMELVTGEKIQMNVKSRAHQHNNHDNSIIQSCYPKTSHLNLTPLSSRRTHVR